MKQTVEILLMNGGPVLVTLDAEDHPAATEKLGKVLTALCAEVAPAEDYPGQGAGAAVAGEGERWGLWCRPTSDEHGFWSKGCAPETVGVVDGLRQGQRDLAAEHLQAQRRIADLEEQLEGARDLARRVLGE